MKILVVGDLMKDFVFELKLLNQQPLDINPFICGGTLMNMTKSASIHFDDVMSLGCLHSSDADAFVNQMSGINISPMIQLIENDSTGLCIKLMDSGVRVNMISFRGANRHLRWSEEISTAILESDIIYLNGWSLLGDTETSETCAHIIQIANKMSKQVVFDILPHDITNERCGDNYKNAIRHSDFIISEKVAFASIFGQDSESVNFTHPLLLSAKAIVLFDWVSRVSLIDRINGITSDDETFYDHNTSAKYALDNIALKLIKEHIKC